VIILILLLWLVWPFQKRFRSRLGQSSHAPKGLTPIWKALSQWCWAMCSMLHCIHIAPCTLALQHAFNKDDQNQSWCEFVRVMFRIWNLGEDPYMYLAHSHSFCQDHNTTCPYGLFEHNRFIVADDDVVLNENVKPQIRHLTCILSLGLCFLVSWTGLPSQLELVQTVLSGCSHATGAPFASCKHVDPSLSHWTIPVSEADSQ